MDSNYPGQDSPYPEAPINPAPVVPPPVVPPAPITPSVPPIPTTPPPQIAGSSVHAVPPPISPKPNRKKLIGVLILLLLVAAVPLTVFISRQQQNVQQEAEQPTISDGTVMFEIGGTGYTLGDIKDVALEQYSEADVASKDVQIIAKDILIERKILDLAAEENDISATSEEISALSQTSGLSENEAKYQVLKEKIILSEVRYIKAVSIGYWVPPPGFTQEHTVADREQIQDQIVAGDPAMDRVERELEAGNALTLAKSIVSANPALADVLSVNGYKMGSVSVENEDVVTEPEIYEYSDSNFDEETKSALFSSNVSAGDVVRVGTNGSNGGESVFRIEEKGNDSGAGSYDEWFASQREARVSKEIPL